MHTQFGERNSLVEESRRETRDNLKSTVKRIDCFKVPGELD